MVVVSAMGSIDVQRDVGMSCVVWYGMGCTG